MKRLLAFLMLVALVGITYHVVMARLGGGTPPPMATSERQADFVKVDKSRRVLSLFRNQTLFASFPISLGSAADAGPKRQEGDGRTPEGLYRIDWRNARSAYHLSLHISYPDNHDLADADTRRSSGRQCHDPRVAQWLGMARPYSTPRRLDRRLPRRYQCGHGTDLGLGA